MKVSLVTDSFEYKVLEVILLSEEQYLKYGSAPFVKQLQKNHFKGEVVVLAPSNISTYYCVVAYIKLPSYTLEDADMLPIEEDEFEMGLIEQLKQI